MKNDNFQDTDKENLLTAKNFQKNIRLIFHIQRCAICSV